MTDRPQMNEELRKKVSALKRKIRALEHSKSAFKEVEEALRESEEKYRNILENMNDGYFETDLQGNMTFFNPMVPKFLGYTEQETAGMNHRSFLDTENAEIVERYFQRSRKEDIPANIVIYTVTRKDGAKVHVETSFSVIKNKDGKAVGYRGIGRDITERKQVEAALRESEERYRNIIENATEGIFQTTPDGRYINVNPALIRMFGFDSPTEMTEPITDIGRQIYVNAEDRKLFKQLMTEHGFVKGFEVQLYRKDKSIIWISINAHAVRDADGNILYYEGTNQDITDRKQAEMALKISEEKYRSIFENAIEGIYQSVPDGHYIEVNSTFARIFGYDSPEEVKKCVRDIGRQLYANPEMRQECIRTVMEQGSGIFEVQIRRKDGSTAWISNNVRAVRNGNGNISHFEGVVEDITMLKWAEEERERLISELQKALSEVKALSGLFPICASCKKIRDDKGYWNQIESYISDHSEAEFSHSICPECAKELYPEIELYKE